MEELKPKQLKLIQKIAGDGFLPGESPRTEEPGGLHTVHGVE